MKAFTRLIAATELALVAPAAAFMAALFARNLTPAAVEPAHTAARVVEWFSRHLVLGLYVFLFALPLAALFLGSGTLWRRWKGEPALRHAVRELLATARAQAALLLVAGATLVAGGILAIVALHALTD